MEALLSLGTSAGHGKREPSLFERVLQLHTDLPPIFLMGMVGQIRGCLSRSHCQWLWLMDTVWGARAGSQNKQQLRGAGKQQPWSCSIHSQSESSVLPRDIYFSFLPLQYLKEIIGISAKGKMAPSDSQACFCQLNNSSLTCHPSHLAPGTST